MNYTLRMDPRQALEKIVCLIIEANNDDRLKNLFQTEQEYPTLQTCVWDALPVLGYIQAKYGLNPQSAAEVRSDVKTSNHETQIMGKLTWFGQWTPGRRVEVNFGDQFAEVTIETGVPRRSQFIDSYFQK